MSWVPLLLDWYDHHKRELPWRDSSDPYKVWVSEIMCQQTRVEAVKPYYYSWMDRFPTMEALANATEDEVVHAWQGLGYYSRARNLRLGAQDVVAHYNGRMPTTRKEVESIKGVGPYTAGAILSMAYQLPEVAVDGNVLRIYARLYNIDDDILSTTGKKRITTIVENTLPTDRPGDFNQALMDFGSAICIPKTPRCESCVLQKHCQAYILNRTSELPVRINKTKVKNIPLVVCLLRCDSGYVLHRRPRTGLLRSMWEFPTAEEAATVASGINTLVERFVQMGLSITIDDHPITTLKHVFSHRQWHMTVVSGEIHATSDKVKALLPDDYMWLEPTDFHTYPWAGPHGKLTVYCS